MLNRGCLVPATSAFTSMSRHSGEESLQDFEGADDPPGSTAVAVAS